MAIRICLVNDYEVVVAGLKALLQPHTDRVEVVDMTLNDGSREVDVALYDMFGVGYGTDKLKNLVDNPAIGAVLVYSTSDEAPAVQQALSNGATGYASKGASIDRLVMAIEDVAAGKEVVELSHGRALTLARWPGEDEGLSIRESEMLSLIAQGYSNADIAESCFLSINTVKTYVRSAYRKIGVTTRPQAVAWSFRNGLGLDDPNTEPELAR